ncbi:HAMP domain-containing histidine kinase [Dactylosporangium roseum]|uniref:histidine kinase n=1 Tax=Dactylosporangium roseum TaxID=47989 RepID=A0ABY5YWU5_9ACTN|nr:HAMP domain-containing sensor histidine kinase [Dactylosporangium roseum]UWZ34226.1 HAMP domain-containing histidine kinase [Dactylosporangium roseum]
MTTEALRDTGPGLSWPSARTRILGWMLLLVALALLVSVAVTRMVLLDRLDDRLDRELEQEARKLRAFAATAVDPATGGPYQRVDDFLARHLQHNVPDRHEMYFSLVSGVPDRRSAGVPPARLDEDAAFVAKITSHRDATAGWADTSAGRVRYAVLPVRLPADPRPGALVVIEFRGLERAEVDHSIGIQAVVGLAALLLAAMTGWLLAGQILAPVRLVRQTAERISSTDLSGRIPVRGTDDIAALSRTFNTMLDRLEDAFATQRQFLDDAGHELRTPITVVRGHLELMGDDPVERAETVALVTDELDRMARIVNDLLVLAKAGQPDFLVTGPVHAGDLTMDTLVKAQVLGERRWMLGGVADVVVVADQQRLTQALLQLAANAAAHTGPGDVIEVGSAHDGTTLRLWVRDTGPGVDPVIATRIFDRFVRGGDARNRSIGVGLGLSIVKVIAAAHGGTVRLSSAPGRGATFSLLLPVGPDETAREPERAEEYLP